MDSYLEIVLKAIHYQCELIESMNVIDHWVQLMLMLRRLLALLLFLL